MAQLFSFEDINRQIGQLINGKSNIGVEIVNSISILKFFHKSYDLISDQKNSNIMLFFNSCSKKCNLKVLKLG